MRLLVTRHYKTLNNETNRIMGWGDAPCAEGWDQDPAWVDEVLQNEAATIASIHASGLPRARRTAMFFARRHGIHLIFDSESLNEVNYGPHLYRKKKPWVAEHFPLHKKDPDFIYPSFIIPI